jgi:transposase, IS6 family
VGSEFKWRHFAGELILLCVRWYCKYGISYRDLEEMMGECGVAVDQTTLYRWVQHYAPELEKRMTVCPSWGERGDCPTIA